MITIKNYGCLGFNSGPSQERLDRIHASGAPVFGWGYSLLGNVGSPCQFFSKNRFRPRQEYDGKRPDVYRNINYNKGVAVDPPARKVGLTRRPEASTSRQDNKGSRVTLKMRMASSPMPSHVSAYRAELQTCWATLKAGLIKNSHAAYSFNHPLSSRNCLHLTTCTT